MKKLKLGSFATWIILGLFTIWTVVPIALVVLNSFKKAKDIFTTTPRLFFTPTLDNYVNAFTKANFGLYYLNSTIVALVSTTVVIVIGTFSSIYVAASLLLYMKPVRGIPSGIGKQDIAYNAENG